MARALGINARMNIAPEATYGQTPTGGWASVPFVSCSLGEERGLIEDDTLGNGREIRDPELDVATNDGDVVVPVDNVAFGRWLVALLGQPVSTTISPGLFEHFFVSGKQSLPSLSIEVVHPGVPAASVNYGCALNQLRIALSPNGRLNATFGIIAQGETAHSGVSVAGSPALSSGDRFMQVHGSISRNNVQLGSVTSADLAFSNNMEKVPVIRQDGRIAGVDPLRAVMTGSFTSRFENGEFLLVATNGTPIDLDFVWRRGTHFVRFRVQRVFLPRVKNPVNGPGGIQATHNWQGSGAFDSILQLTLRNGVPAY